MRMLDETNDKRIENLTLLLEKAEAIQLIGYLEDLVSSDSVGDHIHFNDQSFKKEIMIALYDKEDCGHFSEKYKMLIVEED